MLNELKALVRQVVLAEVKKKKSPKKKGKKAEIPEESEKFKYAEALDFSIPLGDFNVYRHQGAANWGPYTSQGPTVAQIPDGLKESAWAEFVHPLPSKSIWEALHRSVSEGALEKFRNKSKK